MDPTITYYFTLVLKITLFCGLIYGILVIFDADPFNQNAKHNVIPQVVKETYNESPLGESSGIPTWAKVIIGIIVATMVVVFSQVIKDMIFKKKYSFGPDLTDIEGEGSSFDINEHNRFLQGEKFREFFKVAQNSEYSMKTARENYLNTIANYSNHPYVSRDLSMIADIYHAHKGTRSIAEDKKFYEKLNYASYYLYLNIAARQSPIYEQDKLRYKISIMRIKELADENGVKFETHDTPEAYQSIVDGLRT